MEKNAATRATVVISGAALLSRMMGLCRDVLFAHLVGAGMVADIMLAVFRVPHLMRRLFAEGSLTLAFVPRYVRLARAEGLGRADAFARAVLLRAVVGSALLAGVGGFCSEHWVWILAPGMAESKEALDVAAELVRHTLAYVPFSCALAVCMGILNSRGAFLGPALAPALLNSALILVGAFLFATGAGPERAAWTLCIAMPFAGLLQWCMQQPFLRAARFQWRGALLRKDAEAASFFRALPETLAGASSHQLNIFLGGILVSFAGPGGISQLYYAQLLAEFPLGVLGMAVGIASLPEFSGLTKEPEAFARSLGQATDMALFLSVPAAFGLLGIAPCLVSVIFGHGAFGATAVAGATAALYGLAPGIPAVAVNRVFLSACQALGCARVTMIASLFSLLVTLLAGCLGMHLAGSMGVGMGVSMGAYAMTFFLGSALRRRKIALKCRFRDAVIVFGASVAILGYCVLLRMFWHPMERMEQTLFLFAAVPVSAFAYGLAVLVWDCGAARALLPKRSTKRR